MSLKKACSVEGCSNPSWCRSWCSTHYSRWQRNGDPLLTARRANLSPGSTHRWCPRCKTYQPLTEFDKRTNQPGYVGYCKPCNKEYNRWKYERAEEKERRRQHREENRDKIRLEALRGRLRRRYGLTLEEYLEKESEQGGKCAICRTGEPGSNFVYWPVDHCHETGVFRGLLCAHCNLAIGQMKDDPARLRAAADYLEKVPRNA